MPNHKLRDITSNVMAWNNHAANLEFVAEEEALPEADEPDLRPLGLSPTSRRFQKTFVRPADCHSSLLTRALHQDSDEDEDAYCFSASSRRRRSCASNISAASTTDYTCDTGLTTPARTSSPSPRLPQQGFEPVAAPAKRIVIHEPRKEEKKRTISFACAAAPPTRTTQVVVPQQQKPVVVNAPPKRSCIKFACDSLPVATPATPKARETSVKDSSPATVRKYRSPSANSRSARSVTPKRTVNTTAVRFNKNFLTADSKDLKCEGSRFHAFASDELHDDDWIRQDETNQRRKLTIDDTLKMELAIRKLGKEAEEEAEQEEADLEAADEDADEDNEDDDLELDDDDESGYGSDHESSGSEGYRTDEEDGFAESDDDEKDDLVLWWTGTSSGSRTAIASMMQRRLSAGNLSDSSAFSPGCIVPGRSRRKSLRTDRPGTPELPDSTDFVCGTLDEDRPLEEAYMSCMAAKRKEKLRLIPQDIDPSFPTSEPEDDDEDSFQPMRRMSDENVWLHGELEDLDQDGSECSDRCRKKAHSPKRMHSPPPRRHMSPPLRTRGRSPPPSSRAVDRHSPRRLRSPAPIASGSPYGSSPVGGQPICMKRLAVRPGLTHTKSLPRTPAIFAHLKTHHCHGGQRKKTAVAHREKHVRGAIDIVKGLEQRRQRRREKFQQKLCNRARKGLAPERRPQPGKGAERMRELGLLMAGKIAPGNYVLSV